MIIASPAYGRDSGNRRGDQRYGPANLRGDDPLARAPIGLNVMDTADAVHLAWGVRR